MFNLICNQACQSGYSEIAEQASSASTQKKVGQKGNRMPAADCDTEESSKPKTQKAA
jgi:hypothetical protein